jgi:DNA-binding CsgD family transcriptional regulator
MADESQERFRQLAERLTPREWRVLALVLEGRSTQHACESIGIAPGTFESHKQAIRRKLGVPRGKRLEAYLREFSELLPEEFRPERSATAPPPDEYADRRIRWLLRLTLDELNEVAQNAGMRAQLLGQTVRRITSADADEAKREIDDLQFVAAELRVTAERLLREIRQRNAPRS